MQIGLLSDTHGFLDEAIFAYFGKCDEVWHAGDFGPVEVLDRLKGFKPTRGVFGNVDGQEIRTELTQDLHWQCEDVRVYMTHVGGYPGHYDPRAREEIDEQKPDLFICGHSHITKVMRDVNREMLHMNPGACGRIGWHLKRTILRFQIDGDRIGNLELIELGPRTDKVR